MSYIGSTPTTQSFIAGTDYFNGTGSAVNFTLSRSVNSVNDIEVIVNNVEQIPSGYSVSGTTLTFSAAPSAGTSNVYVRYLSTTILSVVAGNVTPTAVSDQLNLSTGYFDLPVGTTAQRPGSPAAGMVRHNTTTGNPEWYSTTNSAWIPFSDQSSYSVEYLVIAGGAGGSGFGGGGGGAGGYRSSVAGASSGGGASAEPQLVLNVGTAYTVTVGAGGAAGVSATWIAGQGNNSVFGTVNSLGGGYGGFDGLLNGVSGGSGGGAGTSASNNGVGGAGTSGQGYAGGNEGNQYEKAAGGGGAGAVGVNATTNARAGDGGAGVSSPITGSSVTRAGGGGGACRQSAGQSGGDGGSGGGGRGADSSTNNCAAGTANTGGGGGGGRGYSAQDPGTAGGSGIVIVRYVGAQRAVGGTVTSSGGYTIHTFTSSGTYTA